MSKKLRIAIISDIHFGPDRGTKLGSQAKELFTRFAAWVDEVQPDVVVDLGDRISDVDLHTDEALATEVASWFFELKERVKVPVFHLLGNHDVHLLTEADNERILRTSLRTTSLEQNGWRLLFWKANACLRDRSRCEITEADLQALEEELHRANTPTIIFTHIPVDNGTFVGNFYFERVAAHHATYSIEQGNAVRELLERSESVVMCVNGHAHWNAYHCVDGIHYITVPSLTEGFPTYPEPCASWTLLSLSENTARLEVFGNLPIAYDLTFKTLSHHWANVDKPHFPTDLCPL